VPDDTSASGEPGSPPGSIPNPGPGVAEHRPHLGRWFEDLPPGLVLDHAVTRTITESDNTMFSVMTMNPQPLHLDESFAETTQFRTRLVNSLLTLSLLIGLSVYETTHGTTVANLGFEETTFPAPVFHGDSIRAQTEVVSSRRSTSRPSQGIVVFAHRAFNQHGVLVATCRRAALMRCRPE